MFKANHLNKHLKTSTNEVIKVYLCLNKCKTIQANVILYSDVQMTTSRKLSN